MNRNAEAVCDSAVAAGLVSVILCTCLTAGDYLALLAGGRMLERWTVLPAGWGEAHLVVLGVLAFVIALVPTLFVAWWMFRAGRDYFSHGGA